MLRDPNLTSTPIPPQLSIQLLRNIWNLSFSVADMEMATDGVLPILGYPWYNYGYIGSPFVWSLVKVTEKGEWPFNQRETFEIFNCL